MMLRIFIRLLLPALPITANAYRVIRHFHGNPLQFGIKHLFFRKEGEEWTMDLHIFGGKNNNNSLATTIILQRIMQSPLPNIKRQMALANQFINFQSDYVKPFAK